MKERTITVSIQGYDSVWLLEYDNERLLGFCPELKLYTIADNELDLEDSINEMLYVLCDLIKPNLIEDYIGAMTMETD